ncbi:MAG: hypothetical protein A2912_03800 [Candidatus Buchananbacteria bacterium RIFCSPLOWO2_01_FULL_40_23b]|uniref:Uncharacterized protein n=1 Tax=Candidatus Buchananbacteria bacterium RIFCSPLOWO2_01_FULL_40_23b TaxID=1797544 RepID=A0A1G1YMP3_9BACT|nr:MAG: hypothetical protein A2912_03800 [Candidatus Buchananbacteria bacterium RIFCSPLOWO2_01_FULL_40_23b]
MKELFVTPHVLLWRIEGKSTVIRLEDVVEISVRSLGEKERKYFREQTLFNLIRDNGITNGSYQWNGEDEARELEFYMVCNSSGELLKSVPYSQIVTPYQRVVLLESKIADEVRRDEYICDLRREIALLEMPGVSLQVYAVPEEKNLFDGVKIFLSAEYDVKANVAVARKGVG